MDSFNISPEYLRAGAEYLDALRGLGLSPEGLSWAREGDIERVDDIPFGMPGEWRLVLITSVIDEAGPVELERVLFQAYNKAATPKLIDPFIVQIMSARTAFAAEVFTALNRDSPIAGIVGHMDDGTEEVIQPSEDPGLQLVRGLWFDRKWVYLLGGVTPNFKSRRAQWLSFKQNVHALAA